MRRRLAAVSMLLGSAMATVPVDVVVIDHLERTPTPD
jgi:hypothetical protein